MSDTAVQHPEQKLLETTCDLQRVAFIFNPVSGTVDGITRRSALEDLAHEAGLTCDLAETDTKLGAGPLAKQAVQDGMDRVLVSGGDGSVTEAAEALAGTETSLAVLPGGTGNLLALNLGIPLEGKEALQLALTGQARPFDVGRANGHVFLIMVGIGVDARMVHDADRRSKQRWGVLAYFVAAARNLGKFRFRYTITIDGLQIRRRAQSVMVANVGRITGGIELVPGADPHDGLLEVAILRAERFRDVAMIVLRAIAGRNRSDNLLEIHRGRNIVIQSRRPQPVQVDGNEIEPSDRLEVTVEPSSLRLVCPEPAGASTADTLTTVAAAAGSAAWAPIVMGMSVGAALYFHSRWQRRHGRRPGFASSHPAVFGGAVLIGGAALAMLRRKT